MVASRTLSESQSKALLRDRAIPFAREVEVATPDEAVRAFEQISASVAVKACGDNIAHKTERGLVALRLRTAEDVRAAVTDLLGRLRPEDGEVTFLVAEMVRGSRELIAGVVRDEQFGPCVMLGIGGVLAEVVGDVVFRPVPIDLVGAHDMIDDLGNQKFLEPFRGENALDREALARMLVSLSQTAVEDDTIISIDINPVIITDKGEPVAVDALIEIGPPARRRDEKKRHRSRAGFEALFDPRGVLVAGASTHPGKFGFVSLHNILASGYSGRVGGTNLQGDTVLGIQTNRHLSEVPVGEYDMVFVCTPAATNPELLRECASKGIKAAFVTSAGYGEAGDAGRQAERELVELCDELGILLAGPNGQGVVSTPSNLCAQIVAPYPPRGSISVASQSGNFVSSFLNWSRATGIGIARAVSAGNAAAVNVADYMEFYGDDDHTSVGLAYLEGIENGRALMERLSAVSIRKPVVVLKGGSSNLGARAAASHTGALASNDAIFDGFCRAGGITRAATVEEAFETAATFATQPLPRGPNVVILTTAGGWGVVTSDAIAAEGDLKLIDLPDDLRLAIDELLPPRWSRQNPIDCAGGETRETIPAILDLVSSHPDVDAIVYLGIGIQSNQARLMRDGKFFPDHGLERIVSYHERQDQRFAQAAAECSTASGKPILVASELALADPTNAGPAAVRASGRLCYSSGNRAVTALGHLYRYSRFLESRRGSR